MELAFQESYYFRMRLALRFGLFLLSGVSILSALFYMLSDVSFALGGPRTLVYRGAETVALSGVIAVNILLLVLVFHRKFPQFWQPYVAGTSLVTLAVHLAATSYSATAFFGLYLLIIACRVQQLQCRWMAIQLVGVLFIGSGAIVAYSVQRTQLREVTGVFFLALVFMAVPMLFTLRWERLERKEFLTKYLLAQERNDERLKREQTEQMLHILSQAIGGIVHDLGNPLTSVQVGAETLLDVVNEGEPSKEAIRKFAEVITDGAQMLNYLRLSLMEQTRVLEGKPVPVEIKLASIRHIVEVGTHFQKPRFVAGRYIQLQGDDIEVCVDEMRFITIFMNLIGNALKYSDGKIKVVWRTHANHLLIAVLDQGKKGRGISRDQAENLFVAFGRLDIHAQVEGTGLGLLSVRKIAEAHEGEVYIEGYTDGTAHSRTFSTAQGSYIDMLEEGFRTAFVTACPLQMLPQPEEIAVPQKTPHT